jgi:hypothetical protein
MSIGNLGESDPRGQRTCGLEKALPSARGCIPDQTAL